MPARGVAARRLMKELSSLRTNPPANICAGPIGDDIFHWKATLFGPEGTPYEGGIWDLEITFTSEYPIKAPEAKFLNKIWHPNISWSSGSICLDVLRDAWSPALSVETMLISLCSLLDDPNPSSPLNSDAAREYERDKVKYRATVQDYIAKYASGE